MDKLFKTFCKVFIAVVMVITCIVTYLIVSSFIDGYKEENQTQKSLVANNSTNIEKTGLFKDDDDIGRFKERYYQKIDGFRYIYIYEDKETGVQYLIMRDSGVDGVGMCKLEQKEQDKTTNSNITLPSNKQVKNNDL